jgi:hypothetical protein
MKNTQDTYRNVKLKEGEFPMRNIYDFKEKEKPNFRPKQ